MSAPSKSPSALTQRSCLLAAKCTVPEDGMVGVGVTVRVRKIKKGREIKQQKKQKKGARQNQTRQQYSAPRQTRKL